ncbi:hypothetical protein SESBI_11171 [Sesbania bispinosa]|nr:hypothetical protein SESBI_11171 [Sesbania bispinosa]
MAENTRLKELASELKRLSEAMDHREATTGARLEHLESSMQLFSCAIDSLTQSMEC